MPPPRARILLFDAVVARRESLKRDLNKQAPAMARSPERSYAMAFWRRYYAAASCRDEVPRRCRRTYVYFSFLLTAYYIETSLGNFSALLSPYICRHYHRLSSAFEQSLPRTELAEARDFTPFAPGVYFSSPDIL